MDEPKTDEPTVALTAAGEFELARAAGFDTYEDFDAWRKRQPGDYQRWYDRVLKRAQESDE